MSNNGHRPGFPQALKRPAREATPPLPTPYDYHFRQHVLPDLHASATLLAPFVARGEILFTDVLDALMGMAIRRGATGLSDLSGLVDHLTTFLANRIEAGAEPAP